MKIDNQYYLEQMKELLKEDYDRLVASFDEPLYKSLRVNPLKADRQLIEQEIALGEQTPFDQDTYYINDEQKYGKHPFHLAGLYYLQEPSATMAVNALDVREGDIVLDLCAAPGGKSTQILSRLGRSGFLFANEYDRKRANTLLSNLERWGADNYLITNSTTENLCPQLQGLCDKVLVDAPCSGSGMFRKFPETVNDFTEGTVRACARRQLAILDQAALTVRQNGVLVYSTCTFSVQEDEEVVSAFLADHPDFQLVDSGLSCGQKGFDEKGYCRRAFPWQGGEGHFVAKMIRTSEVCQARLRQLSCSHDKTVDAFLKEVGREDLKYTVINDRVYVSSQPLYDLNAAVLRQGILLGELIKGRLEPHHHFFISFPGLKNTCEITDADELSRWLKGESLFRNAPRGYLQITYRQVPIGFSKSDGSQLKNRLPKGLRTV
ncbi:MAG: RNA methyltransferase [Erysipelotrichaceae bacterium]|nr:RNA methyltransferase [Erysipelotrichaceae bacterium]